MVPPESFDPISCIREFDRINLDESICKKYLVRKISTYSIINKIYSFLILILLPLVEQLYFPTIKSNHWVLLSINSLFEKSHFFDPCGTILDTTQQELVYNLVSNYQDIKPFDFNGNKTFSCCATSEVKCLTVFIHIINNSPTTTWFASWVKSHSRTYSLSSFNHLTQQTVSCKFIFLLSVCIFIQFFQLQVYSTYLSILSLLHCTVFLPTCTRNVDVICLP